MTGKSQGRRIPEKLRISPSETGEPVQRNRKNGFDSADHVPKNNMYRLIRQTFGSPFAMVREKGAVRLSQRATAFLPGQTAAHPARAVHRSDRQTVNRPARFHASIRYLLDTVLPFSPSQTVPPFSMEPVVLNYLPASVIGTPLFVYHFHEHRMYLMLTNKTTSVFQKKKAFLEFFIKYCLFPLRSMLY